MQQPELDELADAVTAVAGARNRIPLPLLLRETALNVLALTRIVSTRVKDRERRESIEARCDDLIDLLRDAAREISFQEARSVAASDNTDDPIPKEDFLCAA